METQIPDSSDHIRELWEDHRELICFLQQEGKVTLLTRAEDAFRKTLIIATASYFEKQLVDAIVAIYLERARGSTALASFVREQAFGRRFSSLFVWGKNNANYFYKKFGSDFKDHMEKKVRCSEELSGAVKAFLQIGKLRNEMVHGNYADFQPNLTAGEVFQLYEHASKFVCQLPDAIREFIDMGEPPTPS